MKKGVLFGLALILIAGCRDSEVPANYSDQSFESEAIVAGTEGLDLQKLTKNATLTFQTKNVEKTYALIKNALKDYDAYLTEDHNFDNRSRKGYDLTVRVPVAKLENFVTYVIENAQITSLENKTVAVTDVTEEYIDIQARLKIKKETEARMADLLKQAKTISEILEIQKQLSDLRSEIESIEGRLKYLSDQTEYSTARISFYENVKYSKRFLSDFWHAMKEGWQIFLHILTLIAYLWVIILVFFVVLWAYKINRRRKKNRLSKQ